MTASASSSRQDRTSRQPPKDCYVMRVRKRCAVGRLRAALAALTAIAALSCNPDTVVHKVGWFATMRHHRNIKPYAWPIPQVAGTVPVSVAQLLLTRDTAHRLANPRSRPV